MTDKCLIQEPVLGNIESGIDEYFSQVNEDNCNIEISMKKRKKSIYGKGKEANAIKKELGNFEFQNSKAFQYIIKIYGKSIRFNELLGIINSINIYLRYKKKYPLPLLSRNEKRSFPLLIKYIERNNQLILPYFKMISLCDSSFKKIPLD